MEYTIEEDPDFEGIAHQLYDISVKHIVKHLDEKHKQENGRRSRMKNSEFLATQFLNKQYALAQEREAKDSAQLATLTLEDIQSFCTQSKLFTTAALANLSEENQIDAYYNLLRLLQECLDEQMLCRVNYDTPPKGDPILNLSQLNKKYLTEFVMHAKWDGWTLALDGHVQILGDYVVRKYVRHPNTRTFSSRPIHLSYRHDMDLVRNWAIEVLKDDIKRLPYHVLQDLIYAIPQRRKRAFIRKQHKEDARKFLEEVEEEGRKYLAEREKRRQERENQPE